MMVSRVNTRVCTMQTTVPSMRNGSGTRNGIISATTPTTLWSATMLPVRRSDSDTGRAMWLMISIGMNSGNIQGNPPIFGPQKWRR